MSNFNQSVFALTTDVSEETVDRPADQAALDALLAEISIPGEEVVEDVVEDTVVEPVVASAEHTDEELESIEAGAEGIAARQAHYAAQGEEGVEHLFGGQPEGDKPATPENVVVDGETPEQKAARKAADKEEKARARKEAAEAKKAKKAAERAAKPPRPTSVTHQPGDLLVAKLGATWRDLVVFTDIDAVMDTPALERMQDRFIERMNDPDAIADKVKEKITMLFVWLQKGGELNEVMRRSFKVLHDKGELTSGDKGNLQADLLLKPYSMGTARSQANQMFMAFPELQITVKEKGKMVPNPNSVLLPVIYDRLGLTTAVAAAPAPAPVVAPVAAPAVEEEPATADVVAEIEALADVAE